jgi:hypothetical protein
LNARCGHCGFEHVDAAAKFCSRCGALVHVSHSSTWSIVTDWSEHYVGSHGALWRTLRQLFFSPGALTQSYFAGARGAVLKPIQLYLLASLLAFFIVGTFGNAMNFDEPRKDAALVPMDAGAQETKKSADTPIKIKVVGDDEKEKPITFQMAEDWLKENPFLGSSIIKQRVSELRGMSTEQQFREIKKSAKRYAPLIGLLLVPFLAVFTKVFWNHRLRFAEHIVFALHFQAFLLLAMIPMFALSSLNVPDPIVPIYWVAIVAWAWLATRRVFKRSALGTSVRLMGSVPVYAIALGLAAGLVFALALVVG